MEQVNCNRFALSDPIMAIATTCMVWNPAEIMRMPDEEEKWVKPSGSIEEKEQDE